MALCSANRELGGAECGRDGLGQLLMHAGTIFVVRSIGDFRRVGFFKSVLGNLIKKPSEGAQFHPAGFVMSVVGAIVVLFVWHHIH